jgi:hypothetical protein
MRYFYVLLTLLILAPAAEAASGIAHIIVQNSTGAPYRFQVLHQYTGEATEDSGYHVLADGESKHVFDAHYRYGFGTTGTSNWIVNGRQITTITAETASSLRADPLKVGLIFDSGGKIYAELKQYRSFHGLGSSWKACELSDEDDGQNIVIKVTATLVEFQWKSGPCSTDWVWEADLLKLL